MKSFFERFHHDELAVSSIEYALIASLIAVVIAVTVGSVGIQLGSLYTYIKDQVSLALQ